MSRISDAMDLSKLSLDDIRTSLTSSAFSTKSTQFTSINTKEELMSMFSQNPNQPSLSPSDIFNIISSSNESNDNNKSEILNPSNLILHFPKKNSLQSPVDLVQNDSLLIQSQIQQQPQQNQQICEASIYLHRSQLYCEDGQVELANSDMEAVATLVEQGKTQGMTNEDISEMKSVVEEKNKMKVKCEAIQQKIDGIEASEEEKQRLQQNLNKFQKLVYAKINLRGIHRREIRQRAQDAKEEEQEIEADNQVEEQVDNMLNSLAKAKNPAEANENVLKQIEELKKIIQSQQQQIVNQGRKLTDLESKCKDAGVHDKAFIHRSFIDLQEKEPDLFLYCKTFYWSTLNIFNAYKIVSTGLVSGNIKADDDFRTFLQGNAQMIAGSVNMGMDALSTVDYLKGGFKVAKSVVKAVPFVGNLIFGIDEIVSSVISAYNFATNLKLQSKFDYRVRCINNVILSKFFMEEQISITLAKVSLKLTELKRDRILGKQNEQFLKYSWFEQKINSLKDLALTQMEVPINQNNLTNNRIIMLAIQDVSLFIAYICHYSDAIVNNNTTSIEELMVDIVTYKQLDKLVKDKTKSLLELEKKVTGEKEKTKEKKKEATCSIF